MDNTVSQLSIGAVLEPLCCLKQQETLDRQPCGTVSPPELPAVYLYLSEAQEVQCKLKHSSVLSSML